MSVPYTAIARYPYDPDPENASDDLPLKVDDLITVTEIVDEDWLFGSKTDDSGNKLSGYFPKGFIEPYTEPEPEVSERIVPEPIEDVSEPAACSPKDKQQITAATTNSALDDIESNIIHEPENFKNKLQSFNVSSAPVLPMEKPQEEKFVKKSFITAEHRSSYIPPSFGSSKPARKEEKKPDVVSGEIISESSPTEEVEAPRMTLKERMLLLQKQQQEEQQALEAAMKRKEEKKRARHHQRETEQIEGDEAPQAVTSDIPPPIPSQPQGGLDLDGQRDAAFVANPTTSDESKEYLDKSIKLEDNKDVEDLTEEETETKSQNEESSDEASEGDDDDIEEEDEEELRKRRLAERMAKLSGGMGMMGMMGMVPMGTPISSGKKSGKSKKVKKQDAEEGDASTMPTAVPILPMAPGVPSPFGAMPGMTASPVKSSETDELESIEPEEKVAHHSIKSNVGSIKSKASVHQKHVDDVQEEHLEQTEMAQQDAEEAEDEDETEFHDSVQDNTVGVTKEQHPYMNFASPVAPAVQMMQTPSPMGIAPHIPGSAPAPAPVAPVPSSPHASTHAAPAPPIPITPAPQTQVKSDAPEIPQILSAPSTLPPPMPQTAALIQRPAMPPPVPTETSPTVPTFTTSAPPPIPGSAPSIPVPTESVPSLPSSYPPGPLPSHATAERMLSSSSSIYSRPPIPPASTLPPNPEAPAVPLNASAPPVPSSANRNRTLGHAPPPPPPTETAADSGSIPQINRQLTRTSLESSSSTPIAAHDKSSSITGSGLWWTTKALPPQLSGSESYFEVDSTDIKKRNGHVVKYLIYYILDVHLTCITLELAYDTSEPERLLFFHESKEKKRTDKNALIEEYTKYGPLAYNTAVKSLKKSYNGEYIDFIFSNLPKSVLLPIAKKTFGAVVYRNNNGEFKSFDDIRPGDILVLVNASFDGSSNKSVGVEKPHVALVTSFDVEKNRIKVIEQSDGIIQQGKYKLNKMISGKLRVFRIVGRDYVGW